MKILSPINSPDEVEPLAEAGAEEFYAGVLDENWREKFTNVASFNRREWSVSNLNSFEELDDTVGRAHKLGKPVFLAMNALYTAGQYEYLKKKVDRIKDSGVDALIVADPGFMSALREWGWKREIHLSTGATVFNHRTAEFYHRHFNVTRMVIPRHHSLKEIADLAEKVDFMDLEIFIFNSGCKNIDGFCTYHHGANEILHKGQYGLAKKIGLDHVFLKAMRLLPYSLAGKITRSCNFKSDSACLLNWEVKGMALSGWDEERASKAVKWLESTFSLWSGLDPCGACAIPAFADAGIKTLKIVGRENPTFKKALDVKYLKKMLHLWENEKPPLEEYCQAARKNYSKVFKTPCREWCYYPR